jgi:hypothetical protein
MATYLPVAESQLIASPSVAALSSGGTKSIRRFGKPPAAVDLRRATKPTTQRLLRWNFSWLELIVLTPLVLLSALIGTIGDARAQAWRLSEDLAMKSRPPRRLTVRNFETNGRGQT